ADPIALFEFLVADRHRARAVIDVESAAADNANLAHLPADQGRVAGGTAEGRQDAVGGLHAADVLRAGFAANEDDVTIGRAFMLAYPSLGVLSMELDPAGGCAGTGINSFGQEQTSRDRLTLRFGVNDR